MLRCVRVNADKMMVRVTVTVEKKTVREMVGGFAEKKGKRGQKKSVKSAA